MFLKMRSLDESIIDALVPHTTYADIYVCRKRTLGCVSTNEYVGAWSSRVSVSLREHGEKIGCFRHYCHLLSSRPRLQVTTSATLHDLWLKGLAGGKRKSVSQCRIHSELCIVSELIPSNRWIDVEKTSVAYRVDDRHTNERLHS